MSKIKTLNETLWEKRATEPAIIEWLDNFSSDPALDADERAHALFLLSNFMYFGSRQIRELLKALYRDLYRYPIVQQIRQANEHTLDSATIEPLFSGERDATRFLGVGNPSESGCHLLYYFRQENNLPKDLFIHSHQIFSRAANHSAAALRDPNVTRYVFIDDFCGSGKQATEYSQDIVQEIKRLQPAASVAYYALFATTEGINNVKAGTAFDTASAIYELDSSFKCFSPDSRYFRLAPSEIRQDVCEQMCRAYGEQMVDVAHALGFDDSQLLIGFHHNTPDNTLPIIWFDEAGGVPWKPVFRRYPKLQW